MTSKVIEIFGEKYEVINNPVCPNSTLTGKCDYCSLARFDIEVCDQVDAEFGKKCYTAYTEYPNGYVYKQL